MLADDVKTSPPKSLQDAANLLIEFHMSMRKNKETKLVKCTNGDTISVLTDMEQWKSGAIFCAAVTAGLSRRDLSVAAKKIVADGGDREAGHCALVVEAILKTIQYNQTQLSSLREFIQAAVDERRGYAPRYICIPACGCGQDPCLRLHMALD